MKRSLLLRSLRVTAEFTRDQEKTTREAAWTSCREAAHDH